MGVVIHTRLRDRLFAPEDMVRLNGLGEVVWTESPEPITVGQACEILADCEIGVGSWGTPYPCAELLEACPRLRLWEHAAGTVKHMFGPHLSGRGLVIASCKPANAENVAAMTLGEIILGLWRVFENAAANRLGPAGSPPALKVLYRATVGVIGASQVGRRVIRLLQPFGCNVLLYDPFVSPAGAAEMGASLVADLLELCRRSDVVTLHTPDLPATERLLGAREFRAMRDDAVFINTARGRCVDEAALIAELQSGRLLAFLDVTHPEPAAADSPLRKLPNVVLTSHIAGVPATNMGRQAVDDIAAFLAGRSPMCVVTPQELDRIA
ncbi:MAG: phosphoglycerate dehydrogenase [Phycisphaerae bacterium SM23_33]|nr:MAG: phosphoglycerate dehydrogenase [Phycisphaerae bacterium SM23_33]